MPFGRYAMGVANIVDSIYVVGGDDGKASSLPNLTYNPMEDTWQALEQPFEDPWSHLGMVLVGSQLHLVGGRVGAAPTRQNLTYQAIYTIAIPSIVK